MSIEPDPVISINIGSTGDSVSVRALGIKPYILVTIDAEEDSDDVTFNVQTGGGVPLDADEIADFFEGLSNAIRAATPVVTEIEPQEPVS